MSNRRGKKVFVGMSGGVDSSVAAALLLREGYEVTGAHMKCFNVDGCAERDAEDARRVAEQLGIPFYTFDFEEEYKQRVVQYMIRGYKSGITPNPDVMCNKEIKFGLFLEKALALGADYVATGHYVKLVESSGVVGSGSKKLQTINYKLFTALDCNKDQSYFLWTLTQAQLRHCLFPIGEYKKPEVRRLAKKLGLMTALKKDSQGICFLGQVGIQDFLENYIPEKRGRVLNLAGETIGYHKGAHFYTVGQRSGLNSGNWKRALREGNAKPFYVVSKDVKKNIVTVAEGDADEALYSEEVDLVNLNLINPVIYDSLFIIPVWARVRYRQPLVGATLKLKNLKTAKLIFKKPVKFAAEGQSAVFYDAKGEMLGGGIIASK